MRWFSVASPLGNTKSKGKIIVIEGLDKSGKTTQSKMLFNHYSMICPGNVSLFNFPDYSTRIGKEIRLFLDGKVRYSNEVKHMLLSANRWERKAEIEGSRDTGMITIINRYLQSNMAYGQANGLSLEWLTSLDRGLPQEDIVIILDIDPHASYERSARNAFVLDEFEKNKTFLEIARKNYLDLAKQFNWVVVDSNADAKSLCETIIGIVNKRLKGE